MTTPDLLDTWSVRIAEWAAPEETTFAAQTARAYAAGGTPCRHLFSSPGRAPGGMGGGAVSVLPAVLDGLAYAAESLKSALGSSELNNLLSATGLLVGLRAQRRADAASRRRGSPAPAFPRMSLTTQPAWWATLAVALVWPLVTGGRPARRDPTATARSAKAYAAAVLFPAVLLFVGLLPLVSRPPGGVFADDPAGPTAPAARAPSGGSARAGAGTGTGTGTGGAGEVEGGAWAGGVATTACSSRAAPRDPTRPPGLPAFTPQKAPSSGGSGPTRPPGQRTFRTLDVTSADPLSGTRSQAQEVGDRLRGVRWTLHDDGTLTADLAEVPVLRTTSVDATTRLLTGERTERTDVSATTTWMRARLVAGAGRTARLDLVRAATRDMRAVVDCREFTSTSSTAQRLSLTLGG